MAPRLREIARDTRESRWHPHRQQVRGEVDARVAGGSVLLSMTNTRMEIGSSCMHMYCSWSIAVAKAWPSMAQFIEKVLSFGVEEILTGDRIEDEVPGTFTANV